MRAASSTSPAAWAWNEGGFRIEVRLVPRSRPPVEHGDEIGLLLRELLLEHVAGRGGGTDYPPRR